MTDCLRREFANPSSQHAPGKRARALVETARAQIAARIGAAPAAKSCSRRAPRSRTISRSSGVLARARRRARPHLVTSRIEHKSVLDTARALEARGCRGDATSTRTRTVASRPTRVARRSRARHGARVDHAREQRDRRDPGHRRDRAPCAASAACRCTSMPRRASASCRSTSARWPWTCARSRRTRFAVRKASARCTSRARRARSPRRSTAASRSEGCAPARSRRTRSRAWARPTSWPTRHARGPRLAALRDALWARLRGIPACARTATPQRRAPHLLNVTFPGVEGESLRLALRDLAVSAGSACAADSPEASHVLTGMGLSDVLAAELAALQRRPLHHRGRGRRARPRGSRPRSRVCERSRRSSVSGRRERWTSSVFR